MLNFSRIKIISILLFCLAVIFINLPVFLTKNDNKITSQILTYLPNSKLNLGLDLQGGSQLTLEVDFESYKKEQLENYRNELKLVFREELIRSIPIVVGDEIRFNVIGDYDPKKIEKIINKVNSNLTINDSGSRYSIKISESLLKKMKLGVIHQSIEIIRRRVDESGTKEPTIQAQGSDRILLQVPGVKDSSKLKSILGKTAKMTFHFVKNFSDSGEYMVEQPGTELMYDSDGKSYLIEKEIILSGDLLTDANATFHEGQPAVGFNFNNLGSKKFAKITRDNIGELFAIVLDDKVVTAPRIRSVINQGSGVISGSFTAEEAKEVALLLRAGALPAPLNVIEERSVGPSLGQDSIDSGSFSAIIGLLLVVIAMVIFYGTFGMLANIALIMNVLLIIAALSIIGANLTMPGIAGIVLTIGMAVDSNVLIFERIKEEIRQKKSVIIAIDQGFKQAYRTIIDSNITTLIVAFFLFAFGSGPVKGFAVTLSLGILSSMFSAIMLTRLMIALWVKKNKPKEIFL